MEGKKSKKKVLLYYLVLAVCLLVIAAVTVTVVLTVGRNRSNLTSDNPQIENPNNGNSDNGKTPDNGNNGNTPDDGKTSDDPNTPTGGNNHYSLPLANASLTCGYEFAYDKTLDRYAVHRGLDFEGHAGDSVLAVMDGTVTKIVTDHVLNENYVTITHSGGVTSTYKYIDANPSLKEGDAVKQGDVIGTIAAAGGMEMNEGEHLHFEMAVNGKGVDPNTYLDLIEK